MDQLQLIQELSAQVGQIRWMVASILAIFLLGLIGIAVLIILVRKGLRETRVDSYFKDRAGELLDRDDLEGVIRICSEKLKDYPKEMYARWYLAQAHYRKKDYHKALHELNVISEASPSWREHYVEPYIEDIKEKLQNIRPEVIKKD